MKPKRVDQILSNYGYCSRKQALIWIRSRRLSTLTGEVITSPTQKVDPCHLLIEGKGIDQPEGILIMLNKPVGYVCSHTSQEGPSVFELLPEQWQQRKPQPNSVGRLDKDTSGLLLITDDGTLIHTLTSPRHHVPKRYEVQVDRPLDPRLISAFAQGTLMLTHETKPCLPADLTFQSDFVAHLTLYEGRFHQARRMFAHFGYTVTALHRFEFGSWTLGDLPSGAYRQTSVDPSNTALK